MVNVPKTKAPEYIRVSKRALIVKSCSLGRGVFTSRTLRRNMYFKLEGSLINFLEDDWDEAYCIGWDDTTVFDPAPPFRYLNHCCFPHAEMISAKDGEDKSDPEEHLWLRILRTVRAGGQLTVDYGSSYHALKCLCGSKYCRGYIGKPLLLRGKRYVFTQL